MSHFKKINYFIPYSGSQLSFPAITPDMIPYTLIGGLSRNIVVYRWISPVVEDPVLTNRAHFDADAAG
jgi:hypothetical protein